MIRRPDLPKTNPKPRYRLEAHSPVVADVLRDRRWTQVEGESDAWDLFWCEVGQMKMLGNRRLGHSQRVPHFRNQYELSRKNLLARNLQRYKKLLLREGKHEHAQLCDCMPTTFELPTEYLMFVDHYRKWPRSTWIVKPAGGCQGRGIFLFKKLKDLNDWKNGREWQTNASAQKGPPDQEKEESFPECWVVQKYIENPYLIAGRKFDLRIYVLVTSFLPLKIWVAREGFARLSGSQFNLDEIKDNQVHLTNMAVQLHPPPDSKQGCKWSMRKLREFLTARHGLKPVQNMIQDIGKIILVSLQSVQRVIMYDKHCFELYGYDIILQSDLVPWLLEINASPSLGATDREDYKLKYDMLEDVLNVLDMEGKCNGKEIRIGGFDLIWDDGPIHLPCPAATPCGPFLKGERPLNINLGCLNDREDHLRSLGEWRKYISRRERLVA